MGQRTSSARAALALCIVGVAVAHPSAAWAGQTCTTGPFVMGVDVYDGSGTIDWSSAAGAGVKFAIIKASQGTYDTDGQFAANWAATKAAGIVRAPYHFLDPTESGTDQATFFLGIVGTLAADDLPPVLDIECPVGNNESDSDNCLGIGSSGDATGAAITTVMNDWLTAVKAATGKTPIVYSFGSYFAGDNIDTTGLQDYPLYIAYPTTSGCFEFPAPWTAATFWQYDQSGTIAGIGSGVDLDYFLGDAAALTAFAMSGTAPPSDAGAGGDSGDTGDAGDDAGTGCVVSTTGESGVCIDTSECASMGGTATADFCPGPANIQCCTGIPTMTDDGGTTSGDAGDDATAPEHDAGTKSDGSAITKTPTGGTKDAAPPSGGGGDGGNDDQSSGGGGGCGCTSASVREAAPGEALVPAVGLLLTAARLRRRRRGTQCR